MKDNELEAVPNSDLPITDFIGHVTINNVKIPCAVLYPDSEKPIRVFWQREIVGLLTGNKKGGFDRYLQPKNLQKYIPEKFKNKPLSETTIAFRVAGKGNIAQGFEGADLIDICKMYMQARKDLSAGQIHLAEQAEIIVFSFAKTGVDAVIDEATGYEKVRERFALNKQLEKYIAEELRPYVKTFPDQFYQQIFRLNGWAWTQESIKRKPGVVGKWTNDVIYSRFPKGVFAKIQELNRKTEKGYRKYKNFQFLNEEDGLKALNEYLNNAIFLMNASANWKKFINMLRRALGKDYQGDLWE